MAAISMAVSALWAQASKLGEGVQGWWNQQPILPGVDKPGHVTWPGMAESTTGSGRRGRVW